MTLTCPAQTVWDLKTDWSDTANGTGVWSYNLNGVAFTLHTGALTNETYTPNQPAWYSGSYYAWLKSNSTSVWMVEGGTPDYLYGDVVTHTPSSSGYTDVKWISPINGTINISGAVWAVRDIGRSNTWSLYNGSTFLTGGTIASGDAYSRSSPYYFALGSGGANVLGNLSVSVGDIIQLRLGVPASASGDYAGVNLTITAVPEPSTYAALAGLVALGYATYRRRTKSA